MRCQCDEHQHGEQGLNCPNKEQPWFRVNGTREMVYEGGRALEALPGAMEAMFVTHFDDDNEPEVAEIRIYENMPIEALIMDNYGEFLLVWNGGEWEDKDG